MSSRVTATLSEVAEAWLRLNGRPFSLKMWPMHKAFYDGRYRKTLFKTSRQVAKSTTLANFAITECALIPHFSIMFVSPTKEQTMRFSNTRVLKVMRYSPIINTKFLNPELSDRVFHKQFTNGSEMLFTYGLDDADRLRGPSSDRNMYDEVQDILFDPVITVGNETLARSRFGFETYAGTPKTMENTIQYLWENSSQSEWVMRCSACNTLQYVDSVKSVGREGIICLKCGEYLNPLTGKWVDMNTFKNSDIPIDMQLKGFHVNQLIMPEANMLAVTSLKGHTQDDIEFAKKQWGSVLYKRENLPSSTFNNEVLGVSDAIGTRMISKEELEELCTGRPLAQYPQGNTLDGFTHVTGGVDWSGGGTTGVSRTVLWIWGLRKSDLRLATLFYRVYPGANPVNIIDEIALICASYRCELVVGDAGEGHTANDLLRRKLGMHRVQQVQYGSATKAIAWNEYDRYMADRTTVIDNYVLDLKQKRVEFGPLSEMKEAISDILNVYEDITQMGKKVWRHAPTKPDDCLHAGLFGWLAMKMVRNDMKFYQ